MNTRNSIWLAAGVALLLCAQGLRADDLLGGSSGGGGSSAVEPGKGSVPVTGGGESRVKVSYEADADVSYVGDATTNFGRGSYGRLSEQDTNGRFVIAPRIDDGPIYRFGMGYQRFSFGLGKAAPLPNTLQSTNAIVGMDFSLFNSWLMRVEAYPGFYNDGHGANWSSFDVPFIFGGSYIQSAEVQWVVGIGVDVNRRWAVLPDVGVRWNFATQWTLDAVLPSPRLEYECSKDVTLYAGGDFQDGTYRVSRGVGTALGKAKLIQGVVEYDEVRVGGGLSWKATKALTLELETGYLPYRLFDYARAGEHYENKNGAPYGQISLGGRF